MHAQIRFAYEFGPFRINLDDRTLLRDGQPVSLTPKAFDVLLALVESSGYVVEKDALMKKVWPDTFVEEGNLTFTISVLRKALGESQNGYNYIETIPRRGYRFTASLKEALNDGTEVMAHELAQSSTAIEPEKEAGEAGKFDKAKQGTRQQALIVRVWKLVSGRWQIRPLALAAFVIVVGLAVALAYFLIGNEPKPLATEARKIAVLPFKPLVADSRDESLGLGMANTLITKLSSLRELTVLSTDAVYPYASLGKDALVAGRELGVDYVLDGHLQMAGEKTQATWRLLRVKDGAVIWADKCDEQCSNIFTLQDAIAERIAGKLTLHLTGEERWQVAKHYTESPEAYQLYNTGLFHFYKFSREGFQKSLDYFEQAIKVDPNYAPAYAGLAIAYRFGGDGRLMPKEVGQKYETAVRKALALDDTLAEAHAALSAIKQGDWDWEGAEKEALRALELNPNSVESHRFYAIYLATVGRLDEYLLHLRKAQELDPLSIHWNERLGLGFYLTRQYDQAIEQEQKVLDMDPKYGGAHNNLAKAYLQKGMYEEAIAGFQKAKDLINPSGVSRQFAFLAYAYAASGRRAEAQKMLDELKEKASQNNIPPEYFALIYTGLGDKDQAFEWLRKCCDEHALPVFIKVDPLYDSLRSDPRFTNILRCMNLES